MISCSCWDFRGAFWDGGPKCLRIACDDFQDCKTEKKESLGWLSWCSENTRLFSAKGCRSCEWEDRSFLVPEGKSIFPTVCQPYWNFTNIWCDQGFSGYGDRFALMVKGNPTVIHYSRIIVGWVAATLSCALTLPSSPLSFENAFSSW